MSFETDSSKVEVVKEFGWLPRGLTFSLGTPDLVSLMS